MITGILRTEIKQALREILENFEVVWILKGRDL